MGGCSCSLAGTNACMTCGNGGVRDWHSNQYLYSKKYQMSQGSISKRVIEKFDSEGRLVERITEDI
jgi:hypothetical protein